MRLAFVLFKYFPYGGLQRDCLKIVQECLQRKHSVDIYCMEWRGQRPEGVDVQIIEVKAFSNYKRYELFSQRLAQIFKRDPYDGVVGFNRLAGLDVYFGADPCFAYKCESRAFWYRYLPRSRSFLNTESQVYGKSSSTHLMLLSDNEIPHIQRIYGTQDSRFHLLPPGVADDRFVSKESEVVRKQFRDELGVSDRQKLLILIGSGFRIKGVDRAIDAVSRLPKNERENSLLMIVGQDKSALFERYAKKVGVAEQVKFMGGRQDVANFLFAADILIHPAYKEAAGMVLLEALAAQLPVLTTDTCGYSFHIERSGGGRVHQSPFDADRFSRELGQMLTSDPETWKAGARNYVTENDIRGLASSAADVIEQVLQ